MNRTGLATLGLVALVGGCSSPEVESLVLDDFRAEIGQDTISVFADSGPTWSWRLVDVRDASGSQVELPSPRREAGSVDGAASVMLHRGSLDERYVDRGHALEQQFVVHEPLGDGRSLELVGSVDSDGHFVEGRGRWSWHGRSAALAMGDVRVWDADGMPLPAVLRVDRDSTRISIGGLEDARYPVLVDPEIGVDEEVADSTSGENPVLVFNAADRLHLLVYDGASNTLRAQLLDEWGQEVGVAVDVGAVGFVPFSIDAVWNPSSNEFVVAWTSWEAGPNREVLVRRLDGTTGAPIGGAVVVSWMNDFASEVAIAHNSDDDEYLVAWTGRTALDAQEIYAQRLGSNLQELGVDDLKVTETGPPLDTEWSGRAADVHYHSGRYEYRLVAAVSNIDNEAEIATMTVSPDGTSATAPVFVTSTGIVGDTHQAYEPKLAWDPTRDRYLVAYRSSDVALGLPSKDEIYVQMLDADGTELAPDDFQVSVTPGGEVYTAQHPEIVYASDADRYLVVWDADEDAYGLAPNEFEVYAQVLDADGALFDPKFRLSHLGPDGVVNDNFAERPGMSYDPDLDIATVAFEAEAWFADRRIYTQRVVVDPARDADLDGVPDYLDACPGFDDALDGDGDTVPDACDICPGNDALDSDGDTVPNGCDLCPGFNDGLDADGDGTPDACDPCNAPPSADSDGDGVEDVCDVCPGGDDLLDANSNGIPDECELDSDGDGVFDGFDVCPGYDDGLDADADSVPDGCEACPGFNDLLDTDADGSPDGCDACPGFDDALDADADGAPNACDSCPGSSDALDADADGIPDGCDACPGANDGFDGDGDGAPDGCDACPGFDDAIDADMDGAPDACDACAGFDDAADGDADGVPDGCDACAFGSDWLDIDGDGVPNACDLCEGFIDAFDLDGDTVPDGCDVCSGYDDGLDADLDTVPDGCDICSGDDRFDVDGDGVPNDCDACPGGDDTADSDGDGAPDACDGCPGIVDGIDVDGDGVPSGCDACSGFDDALDADLDGVPNGCDICALGSDALDVDSDGSPDACDSCPYGDDSVDSDSDQVPDGCDVCPGDDDSLDADGDGVPDGCDACPGAPDAWDADGDGVPDACDACPGSEDALDSDLDSVPDGCDVCAGSNDAFDADGDSVPDGCDVCPGELDSLDSDLDGFPDGCDVCHGFDDDVDSDGDGSPDGCDVCNGADATGDGDGDGWCAASLLGDVLDCDDASASVHPTAPDVCNGVDDNCDGLVDPDCGDTGIGGGGKGSCDASGGPWSASAWLLLLALLRLRRDDEGLATAR